MGNFNSCVLSTGSGGEQSSPARVVFPGGEVRAFPGPTKAAEPMLETPNHFLVNARSMEAGRRFVAMNADDDLEMSQVYVLFPMKKVNAVVTAADMGGALFVAAAKKRGSGGGGGRGRILPECFDAGSAHDDVANESLVVEPTKRVDESLRLNLDDIDDVETMEFMNRLSMSKSKKPLLETIVEEPSNSDRLTGQTLEFIAWGPKFKSERQYLSLH